MTTTSSSEHEAPISMAANGRLVIPAALRRGMGLTGDATLLAKVVGGRLVLEEAVVVARVERSWLESEAVTALLDAADASVEAGRTRPLDASVMSDIRAARAARATAASSN